MPRKSREKKSAAMSLVAANDAPVVSPLSTSSSMTRSRTSQRDIESGIHTRNPSIGHKSVSFEEDCRTLDSHLSSSMLAAAAAAGAAAAAAVSSNGDEKLKPRNDSPSLRSPSSIKTSPTMTSDDSTETPRSSGPSVITLEHRVKQKKSNKLLKMLLKPSVMAAGAVILLLTGGTAFFFTRFLTIPGLNEQIERLQAEVDGLELQVDELEEQVDRLGVEVDRLGDEVDRLAVENDRFAKLNKELEANVEAYILENQRLNATIAEFEDLNSQLDSTVGELKLINELLEASNEEYAGLNTELNTTTLLLGQQIDRLETVASNLTASSRELQELNEGLLNETRRLRNLKDDLNATVAALDGEVQSFRTENRRLASLNADLTLVVSFLNETAVGIQGSYEEITEFLAEQVTAYQVLALETLQNLFIMRIQRWDCDFQSYFMTEPFATNRTLAIGQSKYPSVMEYVDERVLSELCLELSDFERYLEEELVSPERMTTNQLLSHVSSYTTDALEYYFPSGDSSMGITSEDWAEAGFDCSALPQSYQYA